MGWRDNLATEKQLALLARLGQKVRQPFTKGEASDLIGQLFAEGEQDPQQVERRERETEIATNEWDQNGAYLWHLRYAEDLEEVKRAKRGEVRDAKEQLSITRDERIVFWQDTFRDLQVGDFCTQAYQLYEKYGHRFKMPKKQQIVAMLDALDADSPTWDRDMPEYFFSVLVHNFPELRRK